MKNRYLIRLILFFTLVLTISCKESKNQVNGNDFTVKGQSPTNKYKKSYNKDSCVLYLKELITSSSFKSSIDKDIDVSIDKIDNNVMHIKIINPKYNDNLATGWIILNKDDKKLQDITYDIDSPINLKYNSLLWDKVINCYFNIENTDYKHNEAKGITCSNRNTDEGNEEKCIYKNTVLNSVYKNIIETKEVDGSDYLLKELPRKNVNLSINQDGLVSISYTISNDAVNIELLYEGGTTNISLQQIKNNVQKVITLSAD